MQRGFGPPRMPFGYSQHQRYFHQREVPYHRTHMRKRHHLDDIYYPNYEDINEYNARRREPWEHPYCDRYPVHTRIHVREDLWNNPQQASEKCNSTRKETLPKGKTFDTVVVEQFSNSDVPIKQEEEVEERFSPMVEDNLKSDEPKQENTGESSRDCLKSQTGSGFSDIKKTVPERSCEQLFEQTGSTYNSGSEFVNAKMQYNKDLNSKKLQSSSCANIESNKPNFVESLNDSDMESFKLIQEMEPDGSSEKPNRKIKINLPFPVAKGKTIDLSADNSDTPLEDIHTIENELKDLLAKNNNDYTSHLNDRKTIITTIDITADSDEISDKLNNKIETIDLVKDDVELIEEKCVQKKCVYPVQVTNIDKDSKANLLTEQMEKFKKEDTKDFVINSDYQRTVGGETRISKHYDQPPKLEKMVDDLDPIHVNVTNSDTTPKEISDDERFLSNDSFKLTQVYQQTIGIYTQNSSGLPKLELRTEKTSLAETDSIYLPTCSRKRITSLTDSPSKKATLRKTKSIGDLRSNINDESITKNNIIPQVNWYSDISEDESALHPYSDVSGITQNDGYASDSDATVDLRCLNRKSTSKRKRCRVLTTSSDEEDRLKNAKAVKRECKKKEKQKPDNKNTKDDSSKAKFNDRLDQQPSSINSKSEISPAKVKRRRSTFTCDPENEGVLKRADDERFRDRFVHLFGSLSEDDDDDSRPDEIRIVTKKEYQNNKIVKGPVESEASTSNNSNLSNHSELGEGGPNKRKRKYTKGSSVITRQKRRKVPKSKKFIDKSDSDSDELLKPQSSEVSQKTLATDSRASKVTIKKPNQRDKPITENKIKGKISRPQKNIAKTDMNCQGKKTDKLVIDKKSQDNKKVKNKLNEKKKDQNKSDEKGDTKGKVLEKPKNHEALGTEVTADKQTKAEKSKSAAASDCVKLPIRYSSQVTTEFPQESCCTLVLLKSIYKPRQLITQSVADKCVDRCHINESPDVRNDSITAYIENDIIEIQEPTPLVDLTQNEEDLDLTPEKSLPDDLYNLKREILDLERNTQEGCLVTLYPSEESSADQEVQAVSATVPLTNNRSRSEELSDENKVLDSCKESIMSQNVSKKEEENETDMSTNVKSPDRDSSLPVKENENFTPAVSTASLSDNPGDMCHSSTIIIDGDRSRNSLDIDLQSNAISSTSIIQNSRLLEYSSSSKKSANLEDYSVNSSLANPSTLPTNRLPMAQVASCPPPSNSCRKPTVIESALPECNIRAVNLQPDNYKTNDSATKQTLKHNELITSEARNYCPAPINYVKEQDRNVATEPVLRQCTIRAPNLHDTTLNNCATDKQTLLQQYRLFIGQVAAISSCREKKSDFAIESILPKCTTNSDMDNNSTYIHPISSQSISQHQLPITQVANDPTPTNLNEKEGNNITEFKQPPSITPQNNSFLGTSNWFRKPPPNIPQRKTLVAASNQEMYNNTASTITQNSTTFTVTTEPSQKPLQYIFNGTSLLPLDELQLSADEFVKIIQIFMKHLYFLMHLLNAQNLYKDALRSNLYCQDFFRVELNRFQHEINTRILLQATSFFNDLSFFFEIKATQNLYSTIEDLIGAIVLRLNSIRDIPKKVSKVTIYLLLKRLMDPYAEKYARNPMFKALINVITHVTQKAGKKSNDQSLKRPEIFSEDMRNTLIKQIGQYRSMLKNTSSSAENNNFGKSLDALSPPNVSLIPVNNKCFGDNLQSSSAGNNKSFLATNIPSVRHQFNRNTAHTFVTQTCVTPLDQLSRMGNMPRYLPNHSVTTRATNMNKLAPQHFYGSNPQIVLNRAQGVSNYHSQPTISHSSNVSVSDIQQRNQNSVHESLPSQSLFGANSSSAVNGNVAIRSLFPISTTSAIMVPTSRVITNVCNTVHSTHSSFFYAPAAVSNSNAIAHNFTTRPSTFLSSAKPLSNAGNKAVYTAFEDATDAMSLKPQTLPISDSYAGQGAPGLALRAQNFTGPSTLHSSTEIPMFQPISGIYQKEETQYITSTVDKPLQAVYTNTTQDTMNVKSVIPQISHSYEGQESCESVLNPNAKNSHRSSTLHPSAEIPVFQPVSNIATYQTEGGKYTASTTDKSVQEFYSKTSLDEINAKSVKSQIFAINNSKLGQEPSVPVPTSNAIVHNFTQPSTLQPSAQVEMIQSISNITTNQPKCVEYTEQSGLPKTSYDVYERQTFPISDQNISQIPDSAQPEMIDSSKSHNLSKRNGSKKNRRATKTGSDALETIEVLDSSDEEIEDELNIPQNTTNTESRGLQEDYAESFKPDGQNTAASVTDDVAASGISEDAITTIDLTFIDDMDESEWKNEVDFVFVKQEQANNGGDQSANEVRVASTDSGFSSPIQTQNEEVTTYVARRLCNCGKPGKYICICEVMDTSYCGPKCQAS
ncbi:uncharacterized protein LOC126737113 [Anthonomus grandis grandis]|uniref:uncharacterized protein LOC126737113 n=1 Tax=Anthonomus grandis grandis TaxID=2921223 RepID=UPI00216699FD|nr:uncharacterized protein LOC126737113 [Anthonomus grandis grandis]